MSGFAQFYETRKLFIETTGYTQPLTFKDWKDSPDSLKAALLFVQFFNEITLAWDKANSIDFGEDVDGVSTVMQYLQKQVSRIDYYQKDDPTKKANTEFRKTNPDGFIEVEKRIIEEDPEKFSGGYIYRVAYNCLYCICGHDRKCDKERMANETSSIVMYDGKELCLFDTVSDERGSASDVSESRSFEDQFWSIIEDVGLSAEKVMRYLLSNDPADLKALSKRSKQYELDPLRDIEVSIDAVSDIIERIKEKLLELPANSPCGQYITRLQGAFA